MVEPVDTGGEFFLSKGRICVYVVLVSLMISLATWLKQRQKELELGHLLCESLAGWRGRKERREVKGGRSRGHDTRRAGDFTESKQAAGDSCAQNASADLGTSIFLNDCYISGSVTD
jgi:hypothetical protein